MNIYSNQHSLRVNIKVKYQQHESHRMEDTETNEKNGMIGDGPKHRAQVTWYLLPLLLFEMVLSNGRYPLSSHRASSRPTLHKPTFLLVPTTEQMANTHTPSPVLAPDTNIHSRMNSIRRNNNKPTVAFPPWCQVWEQPQLLLATYVPWVVKPVYLKILMVKNLSATNQ